MSEADRFFENELYTLRLESQEAVRSAADELRANLQKEFRSKVGWQPQSLARGIKVYHFENASYVRLNPALSSYAQRVSIRGNPNLWILLPDGERLGFKRIGEGNGWRELKARWGSRIFFHNEVVIFRHQTGRNFAIYKLQKQVDTQLRVDLNKLANETI